jgi:hypothetical protein
MRILKTILLLFLLVTFNRISAQNCNSYLMGLREDISVAKLCPEDMLDDLQKLRDALDKIHPDMYYYTTKEQFDSAYRTAIKKVSNEMTAYEFSKTIASFLTSIKDSHTNFSPQSLLFIGRKNKGTLPFFLTKIDDKFYLESLYNNQNLKGKEILEFNNFSIQDVFKESLAFSLIEGSAYSAKEEIATKGMALTFSQMSDFNVSDFVRIKYVSGEDTLLTSVKATNKMNLFLYKGPIMEKSVSYFFDGENKGVLKIASFQPKTISFYKKEVANFFKEVSKRNCSEIVIDLRDNQGGYVKAQEYLISYLNFKKKQYTVQHVYKRSNFDPFVKMPFFKRKRFMHRAKREYPYGILSQEYDFMRSDLGSVAKITYSDVPQNEFGQTYNGKCTLVTNGLSMSASVLFASWFRNANRGEIIGSPCLGPMSGTFGTSVSLNLPSTGLPIMISTVKFNPQYANEAEFEPILPDKLLEYSTKDVLVGRDPVWNYLNIRKDENQSLK